MANRFLFPPFCQALKSAFFSSLDALTVAALSLIQQEIGDKTNVFNQNSMRIKIVELCALTEKEEKKTTCSVN